MDHFYRLKDSFNQRLEKYPFAKEWEAKLGVEKVYLVSGLIILGVAILSILGGYRLLLQLVGFVYPAYMSFKAIESRAPDDDIQWLTYWIIYAFFSLTEDITDMIFSWIPMYSILKFAFLIWCYHPSTKGATLLHKTILKPYIFPNLQCLECFFRCCSTEEKKDK